MPKQDAENWRIKNAFQTIAVWNSFPAQPEIARQYAKKDK